MLSTLLLITAAISAETAPRYAVFWSRNATWLIDTSTASLRVAPRLYATHEGVIVEYRLRKAEGADQLERRPLGFERYTPLTLRWPYLNSNSPQPTRSQLELLRFTGDRLSLSRLVNEGGLRSAQSFALPSADPVALPSGSNELLSWLHQRAPQLIPRCAQEPVGMLSWTPGVESGALFVLMGALTVPDCRAVFALRLESQNQVAASIPKSLQLKQPRGRLFFDELQVAERIRGYLSSPSSQSVILVQRVQDMEVSGEATAAPLSLLIGERRQAARFLLWRGEAMQPIAADQPPLTEIFGLRWLAPDDPLQLIAESHFLPYGQRCPSRLSQREVSAGERPTFHCQIEERGIAWAGEDQLSGEAWLNKEGQLNLSVRDTTFDARDQLTLWLGGEDERRSRLVIRAGRVIGDPSLRAALRARWSRSDERYLVRAQLPSWVQRVALRFDDARPQREGLLSLWLAGERSGEGEDQPTLTPLSESVDIPAPALPLRPLTPPAGGVIRPKESMR
ncbi:MAG: hypothetical protein VYD19_09400 [Myxococcota bacterium]|nr:hypothetical protein [Myxococcota bacterium]